MPVFVAPGVEIPDSDLQVAFTRSAGPGGQNVNKVASAVQLRFALDSNTTLRADVKTRLRALAGHRVTDNGELLIVARESRSQEQNRRLAEERLADFVRRALGFPRNGTPPNPASSRERRPGRQSPLPPHEKKLGAVPNDDCDFR